MRMSLTSVRLSKLHQSGAEQGSPNGVFRFFKVPLQGLFGALTEALERSSLRNIRGNSVS